MLLEKHQLSGPQWSAVSQKSFRQGKIAQELNYLLLYMCNVQDDRYLNASHIIRRNPSLFHCIK